MSRSALLVAAETTFSMNLTDVNVVEKCQIKSRSNQILCSFPENNLATIIAIMKGSQNVRRIIRGAIIVTFHIAHLGSRMRSWGRVWSLRMVVDIRSRGKFCRDLNVSRARRPRFFALPCWIRSRKTGQCNRADCRELEMHRGNLNSSSN